MRPRASAVVLIGFTLATLSAIGAEGRDAGEQEKDYSKLPLEQRPYYYDKVLDDKFFQNTSAAFMRLVRNTIYAHAGRTFKDPALRDYFEAQVWYRPRPEGPARLSAADEANLKTIKRLEAVRAEELVSRFDSTFAALVPKGAPAAQPRPSRPDCEANDRGVLTNRKDEDKLVAIGTRLRWSARTAGRSYEYLSGDWLDKPARAVRLACLPDLDGDGVPESIVAVIYPEKMDMEGGGNALPDTWEMTFLVTGKGPDWRGVAPLVISGSEAGVEGHVWASVELVKLEDGRWALAVRTARDACCDQDHDSEEVQRYALKSGKLAPLGRPTRRRIQ